MDVAAHLQEVRAQALRLKYRVVTIDFVDGFPVYLLVPPTLGEKRLLVSAGTHGNEPSGPEAILRLLVDWETVSQSTVSVSFLPLNNPHGAAENVREGLDDMDPNRGYVHGLSEPCVQARMFWKHQGLLQGLARDGFLDLHMDPQHPDRQYAYTAERLERPGEWSRVVGHGAPFSIFRKCDGSFEDWMFHGGCPRTATLENDAAGHVRTVARTILWLAG